MTGESDPTPKIKMVGAVVQAFKLLETINTSSKPLGVSALARESKLNPSTAFNILRTLAAREIVAFDDATKSYSLSHGIYELAKGMMGQQLVALIKPEMTRVAAETHALVGLWQVSGDRVILSDRAVASSPMRLDMDLGQRLPLMVGAVGRAVAASLDLTDAQLRERFKQLRWNGKIDARQYIDEVRATEKVGYSVDRGTLYPGVLSLASVIKDAEGRPIYGITASDLAGVANEDRIVEIGTQIKAVAKSFSAS